MISGLLSRPLILLAMPPVMPPFDPLGYPVPPWILQAISYLTLSLHLLAMNFTVGGVILLLWTHFRKKPGHEGVAYFFGSSLPLGVSYIITLGIPPLLIIQVLYGQMFYSSSVLLGSFWIQVIPLLIIAYSLLYYHKFSREKRPGLQWLIVALALPIFFYIEFIFVNNLTLVMTPEHWLDLYAVHPGGGILTHGEPTIHPRYLLFIGGAFAAAGLAVIWRGAFLIKWGYKTIGRKSQAFGFRVMLITPVLWAIAAIGLYFARPVNIAEMLQEKAVIILLIIGVIGGVAAAIFAFLSIGKQKMTFPLLASLGLFALVACMVIFRDLVRLNQLQPYFDMAAVPVHPQWGMFAIFMAALVAGVALLVMLSIRVFPNLSSQARERLAKILPAE